MMSRYDDINEWCTIYPSKKWWEKAYFFEWHIKKRKLILDKSESVKITSLIIQIQGGIGWKKN